MAEFTFYAANEDRVRIINGILELKDYGLVPDLNYSEPMPDIYETPAPALFEAVTLKRRLYVTGPFAKAPVSLRLIKGGRCDGGYYVDEARGGPLLVLSLPDCREANGVIELAPGDLFYRPEYWDDATTHPVKPSDELKEHYRRIFREVKKHLVQKKITENVWIGTKAWELLSQGEAIILSKGKWWDGEGHFVRSNLAGLSAVKLCLPFSPPVSTAMSVMHSPNSELLFIRAKRGHHGKAKPDLSTCPGEARPPR